MSEQLSLFGAPAPAPSRVRAAAASAELVALGASLPENVRFGTSSWSFPGWEGLVYAERYTDRLLAQEGLAAYAKHPLFRSVGVDRTYYAPVGADVFRDYADAVPDSFRFLVKAHEDVVLGAFGDHRRYGDRAGQRNPRFLDPDYALDAVVAPAVEGLGEKLGVLLLQAPPQDVQALGGPGRFAVLLHRFLEAMPADVPIAVELRNRQLWTRDVYDVLDEAGASAGVAHHPALGPVDEQAALALRLDGPLVVRWMLRRGLRYDAAKARYAPFDKAVDEDDATRDAIAAAVREAALAGRPVTVIVNNKAEGSSPRSVERLARALSSQV